VVELTGPARGRAGAGHGEVPLTPIQRWFSSRTCPSRITSTWPAAHGAPAARRRAAGARIRSPRAAPRRFADALRRLGDGWQQVNAGTEERRWASVVTLADERQRSSRGRSHDQRRKIASQPELTDGPLLRVTYFDLGPGEAGPPAHRRHHLVIDGVAWRILLHDLQVAYGQLRAGNEVRLAPKTTSFQHWSMRLNEIGRSADWTAEES